MSNLNAQVITKRRTSRGQKWSGRRTIVFALLTSGMLWALVFWVAKALMV